MQSRESMSEHHDHDGEHLLAAMPSDPALRVKALESVLVEKGLVDPATIEAWTEAYEKRIGPHNGARVVARAWSDAAFRERLLADGSAAIADMKLLGPEGRHVVVVKNSARVHNLVVCTLCSCYPWPLLGLPPRWYKSAAYRSRAVRDPRGVLAEFGVALAPQVEVRVWDSTAEIRYLVLPERPKGSEGLGEDALARLVSRDAMIGTALAGMPAAGARP